MTWYNIVGATGLLVSIVIISIITIVHRQYRAGKRREVAAFMMLASYSTFVGVGVQSILSLGFYLLSFILSIVALILFLKAMKIRAPD